MNERMNNITISFKTKLKIRTNANWNSKYSKNVSIPAQKYTNKMAEEKKTVEMNRSLIAHRIKAINHHTIQQK